MPADTREEGIFAGALELAPDARPVYLAAVCAKDPALRARIEALLSAHKAGAGILDRTGGAELLQSLGPLAGPARRGRRFWVLAGLMGAVGLGAAAWLALAAR